MSAWAGEEDTLLDQLREVKSGVSYAGPGYAEDRTLVPKYHPRDRAETEVSGDRETGERRHLLAFQPRNVRLVLWWYLGGGGG